MLRVTAYNAAGEMLYLVPDTDAVQHKTVDMAGEAFDLMESIKSAHRWDSERHYDTGNGFIRNRVAYFRIMQETGHEEFWTRAQVAAYAVERAARKTTQAAAQERAEELAEELATEVTQEAAEAAVCRSVAAMFPIVTRFLAEGSQDTAPEVVNRTPQFNCRHCCDEGGFEVCHPSTDALLYVLPCGRCPTAPPVWKHFEFFERAWKLTPDQLAAEAALPF